MKITLKLLLIVLFIYNLNFAQTGNRQDGNYWNNLERTNKYYYLVGFFDGIKLGHKFSISGLDSIDCAINSLNSFNESTYNYLTNITGEQMIDGLNEFYFDYKNRKILIVDAIWLVLNSISGKTDAEMQTMIENYRKNAN